MTWKEVIKQGKRISDEWEEQTRAHAPDRPAPSKDKRDITAFTLDILDEIDVYAKQMYDSMMSEILDSWPTKGISDAFRNRLSNVIEDELQDILQGARKERGNER